MATQKKSILAKFYLVGAIMTIFLVIVILRVFNLQYVHGDEYNKLSTKGTVKEFTISANKGNVYAADGNLLATSVSKYTIRMDLMVVEKDVFEQNIVALSKALSDMLGNVPDYYERRLRNAKKAKKRYFFIAKNIGYIDYLKNEAIPNF